MRALTRRRFWVGLRRRLCVTSACLAYLLAALEIPLPVFVHKKSDQPFPCQNHPCGCQSAEQCWRHCCCFTPKERWAWALTHDVEPPAYAEKPTSELSQDEQSAAEEGWKTVKLRDQSKACCREQTGESSCCSAKSKRPVEPSAPTSGGIRWGPTLAASRCQGYSTVWINVGAVLPFAPRTAWVAGWLPTSLVPFIRVTAAHVLLSPPTPPPRFVLR
jgi:hypothetical protein